MKTAMEAQVKVFDFSHYATMSLAVYLLMVLWCSSSIQFRDHGSTHWVLFMLVLYPPIAAIIWGRKPELPLK
jgi:hypothetical protein